MLVTVVKNEQVSAAPGISDDEVRLAHVCSAPIEAQEEMLSGRGDAVFFNRASAVAE